MKKRISLIVSVILTLTFAVPFAAADAPSVKITALTSFSVEFEYTGAGAESWVGVYADGESSRTGHSRYNVEEGYRG